MQTALAHASIDQHSDRAAIEAAIAAACRLVAPLWPLQSFVAVNPFLGFADRPFEAACAYSRRVSHAEMLMPLAFYRAAIKGGEISDADLEFALQRAPVAWSAPDSVAALKALLSEGPAPETPSHPVIATVSKVLDRLASGDRQASRTDFMIAEISRWCAAWFDTGQAVWPAPWKQQALYPAWRQAARSDRNPELFGIKGFRASVAALPDDPVEAIAAVGAGLGIPAASLADYCSRALFDLRGWAGYVRQTTWLEPPRPVADDPLVHLLAIRLVWGYALFRSRHDAALTGAWQAAMQQAIALPPADTPEALDREMVLRLVLQAAYEHAVQRRLIGPLLRPAGGCPAPAPAARPALQAAFCIDVRSEIFRRALESQSPGIDTLGFAGFFGLPIAYVRVGDSSGDAQCPVLLRPKYTIAEAPKRPVAGGEAAIAAARRERKLVGGAWKAFQGSAVSSFAFVESFGLGFAGRLVLDSLGRTAAKSGRTAPALAPRLDPAPIDGVAAGIPAGERVDLAANILRGMSLTSGFARLVALVGHGSTSANNPHAAGLDCGACGGHAGDVNARLAAALLNEPAVRTGLAQRGIVVPDDTHFLPCLHDTTTDIVRILDADDLPASHATDLAQLETWLAAAGGVARAERAKTLGGGGAAAPLARAHDWAQTRPEWGLAGNAAFIAAPRSLTRGLDLGGRAFLLTYDWRQDPDFSVLELIMTAPMIVASWINLQYYGSTVDNLAFGAGNKVLHNVVGRLGVLEGNGGDLRAGLPFQSLHDGQRLRHEPVRLGVVIAAPLDAINGVIARQPGVRDLVENRWLHLFAIPGPTERYRYAGGLAWEGVL